jgi:pimeloyl-ACP methyl ester carboxylesterase
LDGLYEGPVLVVAGGASGFVTPDDYPHLFRLFPLAQVQTIPGADHWVHTSAPAACRETLISFLEKL